MLAANDRSSNSTTCKLDDGARELDLADEDDDFVVLPTTDVYHYGDGQAGPTQHQNGAAPGIAATATAQQRDGAPADRRGTPQASHDASSECCSPMTPPLRGADSDAACEGASAMDFDSQFDVVESLGARERAGVAATWAPPGLGGGQADADAESFFLQSSFVCVDGDLADASCAADAERAGSRPCCVLIRHEGQRGRQHLMDALRACLPSMTRVDSAFIVHRAFTAGSAVACACGGAEAAALVAALSARGVAASVDVAAASVLDAQLPQLYRVVLRTVRNDMRHMLYVLGVLRQLLDGVPEMLAASVMQEAQYEGAALVCVCALDQAHKYVKGLREYCLEATLEPLRWGAAPGACDTQIEAVRFGCQLSNVPFG